VKSDKKRGGTRAGGGGNPRGVRKKDEETGKRTERQGEPSIHAEKASRKPKDVAILF